MTKDTIFYAMLISCFIGFAFSIWSWTRDPSFSLRSELDNFKSSK